MDRIIVVRTEYRLDPPQVGVNAIGEAAQWERVVKSEFDGATEWQFFGQTLRADGTPRLLAYNVPMTPRPDISLAMVERTQWAVDAATADALRAGKTTSTDSTEVQG